MKIIYSKLLELLSEIPTLKWIDLDKGQLDLTDRPPVAFPCALIEIDLPRCEDLGAKKQHCNASFTIRLGFNVLGETSAVTPGARRDAALNYFDLVDEVYAKLQGYGNTQLSPFSRKRISNERRADGLKVIVMTFETEFNDFSATS